MKTRATTASWAMVRCFGRIVLARGAENCDAARQCQHRDLEGVNADLRKHPWLHVLLTFIPCRFPSHHSLTPWRVRLLCGYLSTSTLRFLFCFFTSPNIGTELGTAVRTAQVTITLSSFTNPPAIFASARTRPPGIPIATTNGVETHGLKSTKLLPSLVKRRRCSP